MKWFKKPIKPTVTKDVKSTLTLYDVNITIQLVRKSYEATLYYTSEPHSRYSESAVKEQVVITDNSPLELLEDIKQILTPEPTNSKVEEPDNGNGKS